MGKRNSPRFEPLIQVEDDGLYIPEVRVWSQEKYSLVGAYCDIFTGGMHKLWNQLAYIDLYSGAGYARIKETGKIYKSSALISLSVPRPFTKYIFCEENDACFEALQKRIRRDYPDKDISLIKGDCNQRINQIRNALPKYNKENKLLPFCFVDPYDLNIHFKTIESLSTGLMDFLILQALHMDGNRNYENYKPMDNDKIDRYLNDSDWRNKFEANSFNKKDFVKFLFNQYHEKMVAMGYEPVKQAHQIRSSIKNLSLYYLAFYSKHSRGNDFFDKAKKYISPQLGLGF